MELSSWFLKPASTRIPSPHSRRSSVTRPERCAHPPPPHRRDTQKWSDDYRTKTRTRTRNINAWDSTPQCRNTWITHVLAAITFGFVVTLTFDIWSCKPLQQTAHSYDESLCQVSFKYLHKRRLISRHAKYSVSQKSSPSPKTLCSIFTRVKYINVKFCLFVASLYPNISPNFCRLILTFNKMALMFLGALIAVTVSSLEFHQVKLPWLHCQWWVVPNSSDLNHWSIKRGDDAGVLSQAATKAKNNSRV